MSELDLEKLFGGFSADTLTPEEKQRLYSAALQNQQLFNTLADEQTLKELLTDPAVRRRLLQTLNQVRPSGAGGSLSWLDWFRRPANVAWAGGLAAAAFAAVLGTKIYQDSLRQAALSVATEETRPLTPPPPAPLTSQPGPPSTAEPESKAKRDIAPVKEPAKKETIPDRRATRASAVPSPLPERKASDAVTAEDKVRREHDAVRRQADAPAAAVGKASKDEASSVDQKLAASSTPLASTPAPPSVPALSGGAATESLESSVSARALFYGESPARPDSGTVAQQGERAIEPLDKSTPPGAKPEQRLDRFAQLGRAQGAATPARPLGLRYSFVVRGADGQDREIDVVTATQGSGPVRLTVEANQDAYLQIWKVVGSSAPQLLFPEPDAGRSSVKIPVGQRQAIPLPRESGAFSLFVRLSRISLEPSAQPNTPVLDRPALDRLQGSNPARELIALQEHATYTVNRDASFDQLVVHIVNDR